MEVKGYLIQNQEGGYLSQKSFWYESHDRPEDGWVHPENELEGILRQSNDWDHKPASLQRAIYDTNRNSTTLTSSTIDIQGLDVEQVKELLKKTS